MKISVGRLNKFLFFKLPSAYLCGVRVKQIDDDHCVVSVKHRWINQNPFNSMYFAVQAMAAELSTGAMVINHIHDVEVRLLIKFSLSVTIDQVTIGPKYFP